MLTKISARDVIGVRHIIRDEWGVAEVQFAGAIHVHSFLYYQESPGNFRQTSGLQNDRDPRCIELRLLLLSGREYRATVSCGALVLNLQRALADIMCSAAESYNLRCLDMTGRELSWSTSVGASGLQPGDVVQVTIDGEACPPLVDSDDESDELPDHLVCAIRPTG